MGIGPQDKAETGRIVYTMKRRGGMGKRQMERRGGGGGGGGKELGWLGGA